MSDLIAIAYPDQYTAETVPKTLSAWASPPLTSHPR